MIIFSTKGHMALLFEQHSMAHLLWATHLDQIKKNHKACFENIKFCHFFHQHSTHGGESQRIHNDKGEKTFVGLVS